MNDFIHSTMAICAMSSESFADVIFRLKECDMLPDDYNVEELRDLYNKYLNTM